MGIQRPSNRVNFFLFTFCNLSEALELNHSKFNILTNYYFSFFPDIPIRTNETNLGPLNPYQGKASLELLRAEPTQVRLVLTTHRVAVEQNHQP